MKLITKVKQAFNPFIATFHNLAEALRDQTATIKSQEAASVRRHQELLAAIASVEASTRYVASAERAKLQRAGHRHDF